MLLVIFILLDIIYKENENIKSREILNWCINHQFGYTHKNEKYEEEFFLCN